MNEHVTSHGFTFSQHMALAELWCRWNGQRGTEKQALRVMRNTTAPDLLRLLLERNVVIPASCATPVIA